MAEMRGIALPTQWAAGWTERIDALATHLMVHGTVSELEDTLSNLEQEARVHGYLLAGEAARRLRSLLGGPDAVADMLSGGLAELRSSLDERKEAETHPALNEDEDLVRDFLVEAREHLSQIEGQMLVLEREPQAMEVIHAVFRAFHTIKGLAGFLDFHGVQAVAHEVETLLDLARNEKLLICSPVVDIVLESGDFLQRELSAIEESLDSRSPLVLQDPDLLAVRIRELAKKTGVGKEEVAPSSQVSQDAFFAAASEPQRDPRDDHADRTALREEADRSPESSDGDPVVLSNATGLVEISTPRSVSEAATPVGALVAASPQRKADEQKPTAQSARSSPAKEATTRSSEAGSVRVETAKLDHLMNMVGEIVIAQSLIRHNPTLTATTDSRLLGDLSQLARVTAEVQRATMSMRMIPVGQLFQRIERVIRDLSRKAGKQVVLETSGTETEIDKTVAEELSDPLLHMVRNSVDHGVELPEERIAAGKTPLARIRLSAHHQGSQIVIQIEDDGRGLNAARIRRKAEERGLVSPSAGLSDTDIYQLIFEPGFSTAEQITDISGRGVGMDVVRRNVEKLQGRIETHSVAGEGTTFQLKLPLTLAIIDGLVVDVGGERYIVALSAVREIFRPHQEAVFSVEGRHELVLVRDQLMPVIRLQERLGMASRPKIVKERLLVVVESEGKRFCLLVDDLVGKQEVVIKSLGEMFSDVAGFSGCAVLGDGRVGLILDVDGVCRGKRL